MSLEVRDYLEALETSAIGFGLASLLIVASLIVDVIAVRLAPAPSAPVVLPTLVRWSHLARGLIAIVAITWLLLALRPTAVAAAENTYFLYQSFHEVHQQPWTGLAIICTRGGDGVGGDAGRECDPATAAEVRSFGQRQLSQFHRGGSQQNHGRDSKQSLHPGNRYFVGRALRRRERRGLRQRRLKKVWPSIRVGFRSLHGRAHAILLRV